MIIIRAIGAFMVLFGLSTFISANARELTSGVGYGFLAIALAAFLVMFLLAGDIFNFLKVKLSTVCFLAFIVYFSAKFYIETNDYEETMQNLIGTTNGIGFSMFVGFMAAYSLTVIYEMRRLPIFNHIAYWVVVLYLAYVGFLGFGTYQYHADFQNLDKFVIQDQEGHYQRAGAFLLMQIILIGSLVMLLVATAGKKRFFSCMPVYLMMMGITGLYGLTAQLIGSNSGLVGPVSFFFVVSVLYLVLSFEGVSTGRRSNNISSLVFGGMSFKLLIGAGISGGILVGAGILVLYSSGVDIDSLRVTGYGEGENTSIVSRSEIFRRNFIPHFAYNPIFGHTQVETLAGDKTTYVHSLLSILTHLGLVGFFLFASMLLFLYQEITTKQKMAFDSLFSNQQYGLYRLLALFTLLAMASVSAFFTWMPLWFAFGMFGEWIYRNNIIRNSSPTKQSKGRRRRRRPSKAKAIDF